MGRVIWILCLGSFVELILGLCFFIFFFFNISPECFYILFLLTEGLILRFFFFFWIDVLDSFSHGKCRTLILV